MNKTLIDYILRGDTPEKDAIDYFHGRAWDEHSCEGLKAFLNKFPSYVDVQDDIGWTNLMRASFIGNLPAVKTLLLAGADVNAVSVDMDTYWGKQRGRGTAEDIAAMEGHETTVRLLRDWRQNPIEMKKRILDEFAGIEFHEGIDSKVKSTRLVLRKPKP